METTHRFEATANALEGAAGAGVTERQARIAAVDDEAEVLRTIVAILEDAGFRVTAYPDGASALREIRNEPPDLVLLDLRMPPPDGIAVCRSLRAYPKTARVPIVVLTALVAEADEIRGLEVGADDYLTKPIRPHVLIARIRAVLRRARPTLARGPLVLDLAQRTASIEGRPLNVTPTDLRILAILAGRDGTVSVEELLECLDGSPATRAHRLAEQIFRLRKKLLPFENLIENVHGGGYCMTVPR